VAVGLLLTFVSTTAVARAGDPSRVEWSPDWPRFRVSEAIGLVPLTAASLTFALAVTPPTRPRLRGGILLDDWIRDGLRGRTLATQRAAQDIGTYVYYASVPVPLIVDVGIVALGVHNDSDVALQMLLIDAQALGMSGVVSLGAEHIGGRQRPYVQDCDPDGRVRSPSGELLNNHCGSVNDNESLVAGHAAAVTTMAGLTCVHHQHLPLYGGGLADLAPCVFMMGAAGFTGVSRIVADKHWASDVLLGWAVGSLSGYVVPSLLHYGFTRGDPPGPTRGKTAAWMPVPVVYPGGAGLGVFGLL
jgi:membrane-associated phospholipid phosphatase